MDGRNLSLPKASKDMDTRHKFEGGWGETSQGVVSLRRLLEEEFPQRCGVGHVRAKMEA